LPFSERLNALGFETSALIHDVHADAVFPARSQLHGALISEEYVEYCRRPGAADVRFRVPGASMQGRQMLIEPERILNQPLSPKERYIVTLMVDFGLKCGWTTPNANFRNRRFSILALSTGGNLPVFHGLLQRHGAAIAQATVHLTEGLAVGALCRTAGKPLLTPREGDCLTWTSAGLSSKQVAERLRISVNTVNEHLASAQRALKAGNRTQAVARALLLGEIAP